MDLEQAYKDALHIVSVENKASSSLFQRKLRIGYSKAAWIMDKLEEEGFIGPANGSKPREIL